MTVINPIKARAGAKIVEMNMELVINMISLKRLIEGGAAIFAADITNHIIVMAGNRFIRPLFRIILRLFVVS